MPVSVTDGQVRPQEGTQMTELKASARVANIEKMMELLEALSFTKHGASVTDLARQTDLTASASSRMLATLHQEGYVTKDQAGRYRLSLRFLALGARYADQLGIEELCGPVLKRAAEDAGELVQLALVEGREMRYVARAEGNNRVRVVSILGKRVIPHAFAAGKVWLAYMPTADALKIALEHGLTQLTQHTITDVARLQRELEHVRAQGFATNLEEVDEGLYSIAVPIVVPNRSEIVGAVALTAPAYRLPKKQLKDRLPLLRNVAEQLGEILMQISVSRDEK